MKFEHLIQINDPANPLLPTLTRQQLWQGLLHRVHDPVPFLPGLESCDILENDGNTLLRALNFGAALIHDRVTLDVEQAVRFDILPTEQHAGGSLTIRIEEPESLHLFLRFAYETTLGQGNSEEEKAYIDYVKSAYQQSDLDCVERIREIAARLTH